MQKKGKGDFVLVLGDKTNESLSLAMEFGTNGKEVDVNFSTVRFGMLSLESLHIIRYPYFTVISQINTLETMQVLVMLVTM